MTGPIKIKTYALGFKIHSDLADHDFPLTEMVDRLYSGTWTNRPPRPPPPLLQRLRTRLAWWILGKAERWAGRLDENASYREY